MNIPEEAARRYPPNQVLMGDGVSFYDVNGTDRAAFTAGAEWARAEALREVEEALDSLDGSRATGYYASEAHGGYQEAQRDMEMALERIRALAEGTPEGDN